MTVPDGLHTSRRTLVKGASWSVSAIATMAAAPAVAASPPLRKDPGLNGWVLTRTNTSGSCQNTLEVSSVPEWMGGRVPPTGDGAPYGLYLYDIEPGDEIVNASMTYWLIGEQSEVEWEARSGHNACW